MIPNPYPGIFIVFEGIDGCGKTAQLNRVYGWTQTLEIIKHYDVLKMKEPGKERFFGKKIYANLSDKNPAALHKIDPRGFQTWYACDSKKNLRENIIPALKQGSIVLCDRFRPSMVYGARTLGEIPDLMNMNRQIIGEDFIWPDLILIFDLPVNAAIKRLKQKNRDLDEHEKHGILKKVRICYQYFARIYPNCRMINAEESEEQVSEKVKSLVLPVIESKIRSTT
ncbi:MAG: dTMP kinase [Candidatus Yanofskybacteria bacterium]|nr:dTMP kinase [Candidatus Yanofskybacteria bacterium]